MFVTIYTPSMHVYTGQVVTASMVIVRGLTFVPVRVVTGAQTALRDVPAKMDFVWMVCTLLTVNLVMYHSKCI